MDDWFDYIFTVLILVFIFFFMFGIFNSASDSAEEYSSPQFDTLNNAQTNLNFLNTDVEYDGAILKFRDLAILSKMQTEEEREAGIKVVTENLFDPIYGVGNWSLRICYDKSCSEFDNTAFFINSQHWYDNVQSTKSFITILDNKNEQIEISFKNGKIIS